MLANMRRSGSVLVVDDDRRTLRALSARISRRGLEPIALSSFEASVDFLSARSLAPTGAMIDICLNSGHFGFEVAREVRNTCSAAVPIMFMTGYSSDWLESFDSVCGDIPIVEKPVSGDLLDDFLVRAIAINPLAPSSPMRGAVLLLVSKYKLNANEARIVGHLASGVMRSSLVDAIGINPNTLKSQIKSLLEKTGVSGVDQLLGVLLKIVEDVHGAR